MYVYIFNSYFINIIGIKDIIIILTKYMSNNFMNIILFIFLCIFTVFAIINKLQRMNIIEKSYTNKN